MKSKSVFWLLITVLLITASVAKAQQPGKMFRIGLLDPSDARSSAARLEPFWQEIRRLGWIEGKNIAVEYRFAEEKSDRQPELAAELVRLKVDLIVCASTSAVSAAKKATTTIPIVMAGSADPVAQVWLPVWRVREAMLQGYRVYRSS